MYENGIGVKNDYEKSLGEQWRVFIMNIEECMSMDLM